MLTEFWQVVAIFLPEPQSRQSAKLFVQSSELEPPTPSPAGEGAPSLVPGGGGVRSLAGEGVGESQFRRGDI
jgi:hypothetical protein